MTSIDYDDTSLGSRPATVISAPRLLVIEDDIVHRGIIGKVGDRAGFSIKEAASFDEAAKLLQKEQFDCMTLDLSLGRNYGLEVINLLADIDCKTPVIVISAAGQAVARLAIAVGRMKQLKIYDPVPKPVNFAMLKGILTEIKEDFDRQHS